MLSRSEHKLDEVLGYAFGFDGHSVWLTGQIAQIARTSVNRPIQPRAARSGLRRRR